MNKMKSVLQFVFVLCLVHIAVQQATEEKKELTPEEQQQKLAAEEHQLKVQKYREECTKETNVDPELINKADQGDFTDDAKLKCFTKCFYQKGGFVTEDGKILVDVIEAQIPNTVDKEKALAVLNKCKEVKGADPCDTIFLAHKCYFEENRKAAPPAENATSSPASSS